MNKKTIIYSLIIISLLFVCFACQSASSIKILIPQSNTSIFYKYLQEDYLNHSVIEVENNEYGIKKLLNLIEMVNEIIALSEENLMNKDNYSYQGTGMPYKTKIFNIDETGQVKIQTYEDDHYKLEYNPAHRGAIREGEGKGYVVYPSVHEDYERQKIIYLTDIRKVLSEALVKIDSNYVISSY